MGKRPARRRGLADVFMVLRKAALVLTTPAGLAVYVATRGR